MLKNQRYKIFKKSFYVICSVLLTVFMLLTTITPVLAIPPTPLFEASLKGGNYGAGTAINTMPPDHGGSPGVLGITDSAEGVSFTSTELDGRSNALINWVIPSDRRNAIRSNGTISFMFKADRQNHVSGEIIGENYGFDQFNHGQGTFGAWTVRNNNGTPADKSDDTLSFAWKTWHNNVWYHHGYTTATGVYAITLEYDQWYSIGLAWGGPGANFETWVCSNCEWSDSNVALPWGSQYLGTGSGTNMGLGDNHQRGYDAYGSAAGVTFADISIFDQYVTNGNTQPCEVNEYISLTPATAINPFGTPHTVTATLQDETGMFIVGRSVTISVISGPTTGTSSTSSTDINGQVSMTYVNNGVVTGIDIIVASFMNSHGQEQTSDEVTKEWVDGGSGNEPGPEVGGDIYQANKLWTFVLVGILAIAILSGTILILKRRHIQH